MSSPSATVTFSNGVQMPVIGIKSWRLNPSDVTADVKTAIMAGYRHIDTDDFDQTPTRVRAVGVAIKELIEEGFARRQDLFITAKAWFPFCVPGFLEKALRNILEDLQMDYVDLFLQHKPPIFLDEITPIQDAWRQFDEVYKKGLTRAVGVINWTTKQIECALALGLTPVHNSQVQLHHPPKDHVDFCNAHNVVVTSLQDGNVSLDDDVDALAKKYKKTRVQVHIRYALDRGLATVSESGIIDRINETYNVFDFALTAEEVKSLEDHDWSCDERFRH